MLCGALVNVLIRILQMHTLTVRERRRAELIFGLNGYGGGLARAAVKLGKDVKTVRTWYRRARDLNACFVERLDVALAEPGHAGSETRAITLVREFLQDTPRSGRPPTYTPRQYMNIMAIVLSDPSESGRPITHWTAREVAEEAHARGICGISQRQVGRFLAEIDLQPHKFRYWLNPKMEDGHDDRIRAVCDAYALAGTQPAGTRVVSVDEKTSIQAKERIHADKPAKCGFPAKLEAEYRRHGTLCLIPSFDVVTGQIIQYRIGQTRDEQDFTEHIACTLAGDPDATWIFVLDQLNTHASESLVKTVASQLGCDDDLGVKGRSGILQSLATRKRFLEDAEHRVRFVYTPKHCSWMNQVEIWFSVLVRKVLKRGSFVSTDALKSSIEQFIDYFNRTMARPYKWTYGGKPLST